MNKMIERSKELVAGTDSGHTRYQIERFIVGRQVTPWARYQQCLAEIRTRLPHAEKGDPVATRELEVLLELAESLHADLGDVGPERARELEEDVWYHRARRKLAVDLLVHKCPSEGTVELILNLHPAAREKLLGVVERASDYDRHALRSWLYNEPPALEA